MRLACLLALAAAGQVSAQKFPFLLVPGGPHGIYNIFQDSHSGMWLGTIDDVVRFDGQHYYSLRPYGFPKEIPNGFAEDSDGGIWIATQGTDVGGGTKPGGLYRYRAGHVERELTGDGLSVISVAPGLMLAAMGTEASGKPTYGDLVLFRKSAQGWTATTLLNNQADHLSLDHQGNLLFPCPGGWCEIATQQLRSWQNASSGLVVRRHAASPLIERVLRDKFGCVWTRTETFATYQCATDPQPVKLPAELSSNDTTAHLEETADGSIFMLVPMVLGRPGNFQRATQTEGLPNPMDTATVGKDGTIWIGADAGLYRFTYPFQVEYWDRSRGLDGAYSIAAQHDTVFTTYDFVYKMDTDRHSWRQANPIGRIGAIWPGPQGTLFAYSGQELAQFDSQGGKVLSEATMPDPGSLAIALTQGSGETVWLGRSSVYRVVPQGKRLTFLQENVPKGSIDDMKYDAAHDTLWACDTNRVIFRKDGQWGVIAQKDGLLDLPCTSIGIEADGDIWIGYRTKASAWIHSPASGHPIVHNFTQWINDVATNSATSFMLADRRNRLWWGLKDVFVSSPADARQGQWIRLDKDDWLDADAQSKSLEALQPADDGSVWISWGAGITHFSPAGDFTTRFPAPPVFIAGFSAGSANPTLAGAIGPVPRNTPLTAHIGMLQFDRRGAIHLRYRILPGQKNWTFASGFDLPLGILRWGPHTLQVQAQLATGPWSSIAEQPFDIPWPLWLTWPAWLFYGTSGVGIGFGVHRWRKKIQFEHNLSLPDLTAWRLGALSPETEALIGTVIDDRYEIGHILSVGGFATVARARDLKQNGELCAIKIFRYELGDRAWIRHRFEQEISALEQVRHPNIVRITGHGNIQPGVIQSGAPYLVMEFIHGRNLREYLEKGALPRTQVAVFLRQLSGALSLLHRAQIFHRDLKPENLMIRSSRDGQLEIVLIDFSIAIVKAPDQTFHGISRVAGTLDYMAPEQVIGYADASTDIYSLAKVLLEMVTGLRWTEFLPEAKLDLPDQLRDYFRAHPDLFGPVSVEMFVSALAFDPGGRPKNVQQFAQPIIRDLERF
jgi:hypothetical protein